jgi:hypothetical protein
VPEAPEARVGVAHFAFLPRGSTVSGEAHEQRLDFRLERHAAADLREERRGATEVPGLDRVAVRQRGGRDRRERSERKNENDDAPRVRDDRIMFAPPKNSCGPRRWSLRAHDIAIPRAASYQGPSPPSSLAPPTPPAAWVPWGALPTRCRSRGRRLQPMPAQESSQAAAGSGSSTRYCPENPRSLTMSVRLPVRVSHGSLGVQASGECAA